MPQPPPQRFTLTYCLVGSPKSAVMLDFGEVLIGRGSDCQIIIEDLQASRHHAALSLKLEGITLTDLGSHNGTYLGGRRIPAHITIPLRSGQPFNIGAVEFSVLERGMPVSPPQPTHPAGSPSPSTIKSPAAWRSKISIKWLLLILLLIFACLLAAGGGLLILWGSQAVQVPPAKQAQIGTMVTVRKACLAGASGLCQFSPTMPPIICARAYSTYPDSIVRGGSRDGNLRGGETVFNPG
jgi:hypothetical protein